MPKPLLPVHQIARICHEANRAYCESVEDFSQPCWNEAHEHMITSTIDGILYVIANPDTNPEQIHENWMRSKADHGWIYGHLKDPIKRTHPCMVAYDRLPEEQKIKDRIFISLVKALAYEG